MRLWATWGYAYDELGEARQAIGLHERRLEMAREIGDRRGEGNALGSLGVAYAALGECDRRSVSYEQRLEIAREIGDQRGKAMSWATWGLPTRR